MATVTESLTHRGFGGYFRAVSTKPAWDAARSEMREVLVRQARLGRPIAYSELVTRVASLRLDYHDPLLNQMLGEISESEDREGRGMLTVLVVYKDGEMRPGPGFFELAKQLGRDTSDLLACWVREYEDVVRYWQSHYARWPGHSHGAASRKSLFVAPLLDAVRARGFQPETCAMDKGYDHARVHDECEARA